MLLDKSGLRLIRQLSLLLNARAASRWGHFRRLLQLRGIILLKTV